jgi:hypothetical protein
MSLFWPLPLPERSACSLTGHLPMEYALTVIMSRPIKAMKRCPRSIFSTHSRNTLPVLRHDSVLVSLAPIISHDSFRLVIRLSSAQSTSPRARAWAHAVSIISLVSTFDHGQVRVMILESSLRPHDSVIISRFPPDRVRQLVLTQVCPCNFGHFVSASGGRTDSTSQNFSGNRESPKFTRKHIRRRSPD